MAREIEIAGINGIGVETGRKPSVGVALIIVGIDPSRNGENITKPTIWTIVEKQDKEATEKRRGQISIPADTRKTGEDHSSNVFGALIEFTDNDQTVNNNLFIVQGVSNFDGKASIKNGPVDVVVLIHENSSNSSITPQDIDEVAANRWIGIDDLNDMVREDPEQVRSFVRQIVDMEASERFIEGVVAEYFRNPFNRLKISMFKPVDFISLKQFHREREKLQDVV